MGLDSQSDYDGPDAVYSFTIPAGKILRATVHTETAWDAALLLLGAQNCTSQSTCLAGTDQFIGTTMSDEQLVYQNTTTEALSVFLVVEGLLGDEDPGEYTLTVQTADPVAGDKCSAPIAGGSGGTFTGTLVNALNDLAPTPTNCPGLDSSVSAYATPEVFYAITVPAAMTLTASVTPTGDPWDVAIYGILATQCTTPTPMCVGASDAFVDTVDAETFTYSNTTAASQDVLVGIEGFGSVGDFSLTLTLSAIDGGVPTDGGTPVDGGMTDGGGLPQDAGPPSDGG